ncbi:sugar ABC transporter substrate-binding protein, partial [Streptacidiphilus monticola]
MTRTTRRATVVAIGLGIALSATGCAGGSSGGSGSGSSGGNVTLTVWENAQPGPGAVYWTNAAKAYHALHPNVTIKIQQVQ